MYYRSPPWGHVSTMHGPEVIQVVLGTRYAARRWKAVRFRDPMFYTRPWLSHHMTFANHCASRLQLSLDGDKPVYINLHIRDDHEPNITCCDTLEGPMYTCP